MSAVSRIPEPLKRLLRPLRHAPDRLLHRRRSRRLLDALAKRDPIRSAVFICLGNINRSAYAAAVFQAAVPEHRRDQVVVRSAGFIGPDRPAGKLSRALAARRGYDLAGHRSRVLDVEEINATDLVVVMDANQQRDVCRLTGRSPAEIIVLGDLDPQPIRQRTIQDPYGHPEDVFEEVFDRIDRCIGRLNGVVWDTGRNRP